MGLKNKIGAFFGNTNSILPLLRSNPGTAMKSYGIVIADNGLVIDSQLGGSCALTLQQHPDYPRNYILQAVAGAGDWYRPYHNGSAHYCDVPKAQPNGTLVVTASMTGCALEVRDIGLSNRFYHDADGQNMPNEYANAQKFRADSAAYSGQGEVGLTKSNNYRARSTDQKYFSGTYLHTIICVKRGANWRVYNNCFFAKTVSDLNSGNIIKTSGRQLQTGIPHFLGEFLDA